MSHFEVFPGKDEQHYWRLRADNGEIVAQSEGYGTAYDAERGAADATRAAVGARTLHNDQGSNWTGATTSGFSIDVRLLDAEG